MTTTGVPLSTEEVGKRLRGDYVFVDDELDQAHRILALLDVIGNPVHLDRLSAVVPNALVLRNLIGLGLVLETALVKSGPYYSGIYVYNHGAVREYLRSVGL